MFVLVPSVAYARYEGNFNLFAGTKWLNSGDWEPVDTQRELGLMLAFGEERSPVHFALDALVSSNEAPLTVPSTDTWVRGSSAELGIGVRKVWKKGATRPHVGAGAAAFRVSADSDGPSGPSTRSDRGYGAWVDAGVTWRIAGHLNLGVEARYSSARTDLGSGFVPREVGAGGIHVGALIGYGW